MRAGLQVHRIVVRMWLQSGLRTLGNGGSGRRESPFVAGSAHAMVLYAQGLVSGTVRSTRSLASCQPRYSYRDTASAVKV